MGTNTNQIGIAILFLGAMTNSEADLSQIGSYTELRPYETGIDDGPSHGTGGLTLPPRTEDVTVMDEELIIVQFANKLLQSSTDIEPELGRIIQKRFLDML